MLKNKVSVSVLFVLLFITIAFADVPPPENQVRVTTNLIVETKEDFSDYKFFLTFPGIVRSIEIKSNDRTIIEAGGGGARFSSGTLFAVPKGSLKKFGDLQTPQQLESLYEPLTKKYLEGVIELVTHRFMQEVPVGEQDTFMNQPYLLERNGSILTVNVGERNAKVSQRTGSGGGVDFSLQGTGWKFTPLFYILVGGIVLSTLALIIFGIRRFRQGSIK